MALKYQEWLHYKRGKFYFNGPGYETVGRPERVELYFDFKKGWIKPVPSHAPGRSRKVQHVNSANFFNVGRHQDLVFRKGFEDTYWAYTSDGKFWLVEGKEIHDKHTESGQ